MFDLNAQHIPGNEMMQALQGNAMPGPMQDWRQQRPDRVPGMAPGQFRQEIGAWRDMRPNLMPALNGQFGQLPSLHGMAGHGQQMQPGPVPQQQGQVGSSYGVIGATPAASPFGLPTY